MTWRSITIRDIKFSQLRKELKLRRAETFGGWLGVGSEFNGQSYFIPNIPDREGTYENRFNDIQFGLSYDRIFMKRFMFSVNTGFNQVITTAGANESGWPDLCCNHLQ